MASGPKAKGELGLASLTAAMLEQGTTPLRGRAERRAAKLGASISVSSAQYNNLITISSLADKLPETLALVREVLLQPGLLGEADFSGSGPDAGHETGEQQPEWLAGQAFRKLVWRRKPCQPSDRALGGRGEAPGGCEALL